MPEDFPEGEDRGPDTPVAHDDIMQRLLRYQRQLRGDEDEPGGVTDEASGPAEVPVGTTEVSDGSADTSASASAMVGPATPAIEPPSVEEPPPEPPAPTWVEEPPPAPSEPRYGEPDVGVTPTILGAERDDLAQRVAQLEQTLTHVARMVTELREQFQDLAVAADERLGDIERALSAVRPDATPEVGPGSP